VVTWDPRGAGESTHDRPYDLATDAGDLSALIEEAGEPTVAISLGRQPVPLVVADLRPDLVQAVVMVGGLGLSGGTDPDSILDSESVSAASLQMAGTDPRGLQRAWIALGNPQLDDAGVRERLEAQLAYCPVESWVERAESYLSHDATRACTALGDRLWLVHWVNPMSPGHPMEHMRAMLPDAHIVELADGPISRPELTAAVVREVTESLAR
jgi:pimeloyl-ACP methyl ester carboxylesterase